MKRAPREHKKRMLLVLAKQAQEKAICCLREGIEHKRSRLLTLDRLFCPLRSRKRRGFLARSPVHRLLAPVSGQI